MISALLAPCAKLDQWVHQRLGRPYGVVLTVGLIIEIAHRLAEAHRRMSEASLVELVLLVLLNGALLLHQLAELSERVSARPKPPEEAKA